MKSSLLKKEILKKYKSVRNFVLCFWHLKRKMHL